MYVLGDNERGREWGSMRVVSAYITTINCMQQLLAMTFTLAVAVAVPATALSALLPLPQPPSLLMSQDLDLHNVHVESKSDRELLYCLLNILLIFLNN